MKELEQLLLQIEQKLLKVLHILYEGSGIKDGSIKGSNGDGKEIKATIPSVKSKYRHLIQEISESSYDDAVDQLTEVYQLIFSFYCIIILFTFIVLEVREKKRMEAA
jgi:hypothetical protein